MRETGKDGWMDFLLSYLLLHRWEEVLRGCPDQKGGEWPPHMKVVPSGDPPIKQEANDNEKIQQITHMESTHKDTILHISEDLSWTINTASLAKKSQQRLYFLRKLKRARRQSQSQVYFFQKMEITVLIPTNTIQ